MAGRLLPPTPRPRRPTTNTPASRLRRRSPGVWFLATEAGLQAEVARRTIQDSDPLVQLAETRPKVGVGNDEDVFVARASAWDLPRCAARDRAGAGTGAARHRAARRPLSGRDHVDQSRSFPARPTRFPPDCRPSCSNVARM